MKSPYFTKSPTFWLSMLATIAIVVGVRELAFAICTNLGMPSAANIVGLVSLFLVLMVIRLIKNGLPNWLASSANVLLVDSGFAFLPVSAGAGILLFALGAELLAVSVIIIVSTLMPLWAFARLAQRWLTNNQIGMRADKGGEGHSNA
ncbi:CidA/LrgA family protein [Moraxella oculi]|uniref:CidA/LrgA family protein n=1 Tax=Moraxella oculi TaxID=2940516 RepID=A0ABW8U6Q5_9GAMM